MSRTAGNWTRSISYLGVLLLGVALGVMWAPRGDVSESPSGDSEASVWTCSMHPSVRAPEQGSCPLCGMDLIEASTVASSAIDEVVLSPRARALARLRTVPVRRERHEGASISLSGKLEPAETTRRTVTTWVAGRIDRLHVKTTGERVRRGQTIATLYSPEVYSAHQDLLTAQGQVSRLRDSPEAARQAARSALGAAREKLRLLGVPDDELDAMATAEAPRRTINIPSYFTGTIIERTVTEGSYVETGAILYRIADLDTLWAQLDAYESDLAQLAPDQLALLTVDALPGETFEGRVAFIEPSIDSRRRTARVRIEVANVDGRLRPGMFVDARVMTSDHQGLAPLVVPASAPLFTGRRSVVYVEDERGEDRVYTPRTVRLGPRRGEIYPVVSGLSAGERVVSRGAFALDADLQIRGGASMLALPDDGAEEGVEPISLPDDALASLGPVVQDYVNIQRALAEDDVDLAAQAARAMVQRVDDISLPAVAREAWSEIAEVVKTEAGRVAVAKDLEASRGAFEVLSGGFEQLLLVFGNPLDTPIQLAFCPMAMGNVGARWLQQSEVVDNAYFGASMRRCGEIRGVVAPGTYLSEELLRPGKQGHEGHVH